MHAFRLFVNGDCASIEQPVRPFYFWSAKTIPNGLWKKYKTGWTKILNMMINCDDLAELKLKIENQQVPISNDNITMYYNKGVDYVHSQVEYIKAKGMNWETWVITTWNRNINYSRIKAAGTEEDKKRLGPETHHNKKHAKKRTRRN